MAATPGQASDSAVRDGGSGSIDAKPPRPKLDKAMALMAAGEIANELCDAGFLQSDELPQACKDIAVQGGSRLYADGYSLARDLENYCGWEPNLRMAEILDNYGDAARKQIELAERDWVDRNDIKPQHAIGTRVDIGSGEFGEITGVYNYGVAKYEVKIEGDADALPPKNARRIVKFENAQAAAPVAHGTETCGSEAGKPV